jgi:hypothetical protein
MKRQDTNYYLFLSGEEEIMEMGIGKKSIVFGIIHAFSID